MQEARINGDEGAATDNSFLTHQVQLSTRTVKVPVTELRFGCSPSLTYFLLQMYGFQCCLGERIYPADPYNTSKS